MVNFGIDENGTRDAVAAEAAQGRQVATVAPETGVGDMIEAEAPQAREVVQAPPRSLAEVSEGSDAYNWAVAQIVADWGEEAVSRLMTLPGVVSAEGAIQGAARFGMRHPEIAEGLALSGFGNHPSIVWAAMMLDRKYGATMKGKTAMETNEIQGGSVDKEIDVVRDQLADLQTRQPWKTREIGELYQKELALLSLRDGPRPIIGSGGRTA